MNMTIKSTTKNYKKIFLKITMKKSMRKKKNILLISLKKEWMQI